MSPTTLRKLRLHLVYAKQRVRFLFRDRDLDFRPLFVCGMMGSGTTLLARLLDQHFELAGVANETALRIRRRSGIRLKPTRIYDSLDSFERALRPHGTLDPSIVRQELQRLYRLKADVVGPGGNPIVDKAPNAHLARAGLLSEAFPESHFLLLYREPVAAVEGLQRKWRLCRQAGVDRVARFWVNLHETFMRDAEEIGSRVVPVPYANLVGSPHAVLAAVAARCQLTQRSELKPYGDRGDRPGYGVRNVADGRIRISPGSNRKAAARLTDAERRAIEEEALGCFERLEKSFPAPM